jgi:hypothetical protein
MIMHIPRPAWWGNLRKQPSQLIAHSILVVLWGISPSAFPASIYTERFEDDTGGWTTRSQGILPSAFSLGITNGTLSAQIAPYTGFGGDLSVYYLSATGASRTANFVGNYRAAGALLIGFDVQAVNLLPSRFELSLRGGDSGVNFVATSSIITTGQWYSFRLSMVNEASAPWSGNIEDFEVVLSGVDELYFLMARASTNAATFLFDNVFIDRLPASTMGGGGEMTWSHLREGESYRIDATTNLVASPVVWSSVTNFVASTNFVTVAIEPDPDHPIRFYRMVME